MLTKIILGKKKERVLAFNSPRAISDDVFSIHLGVMGSLILFTFCIHLSFLLFLLIELLAFDYHFIKIFNQMVRKKFFKENNVAKKDRPKVEKVLSMYFHRFGTSDYKKLDLELILAEPDYYLEILDNKKDFLKDVK